MLKKNSTRGNLIYRLHNFVEEVNPCMSYEKRDINLFSRNLWVIYTTKEINIHSFRNFFNIYSQYL